MQLQEDLKSTKDSFCFEIDLQQKKEVKLNNEIARLSAVIKSLTERIEPSEQQVREQLNELSQRKAEIQVKGVSGMLTTQICACLHTVAYTRLIKYLVDFR